MTDDQAQPPTEREEREEVEEAIAHALLHKVVTGWRTARMGTYWRKAEVSIEGTVGAEREWARRAAKTIADALRTHSPEEPFPAEHGEDDILERLRRAVEVGEGTMHESPVPITLRDLRDAADEIERIRARADAARPPHRPTPQQRR